MSVEFTPREVIEATAAVMLRPGDARVFRHVSLEARSVVRGGLFIAFKGHRFDAHDFVEDAVARGAIGVIVEDATKVPRDSAVATFVVDNGLVAFGQLALAHRRRFPIPVVAITGSNGKSATRDFVASIFGTRGHALKTWANQHGDVGVPTTLFRLSQAHVAAVVEVGMTEFGQVGRLTRIIAPDAALITNVQPVKLSRVRDVDGVAQATGECFRELSAASVAVINVDDERIVRHAAHGRFRRLTFGRSPGADVRLLSSSLEGSRTQLAMISWRDRQYAVRLQLPGGHNAENAAGAFALATAAGYSGEECVAGLQALKPSAHRLQVLDGGGGITVIDDSHHANQPSMFAALKFVAELAARGRAVVVLGDMADGGRDDDADHAELGEMVANSVGLAAFIGPRMASAHGAARKQMGARARHFTDLRVLVRWLRNELNPHDYVLVKGSRVMHLERVVEALASPAEVAR